ncbi:hypothetical protein J624_0557 [Acinetobacter baumannii 1062314]|nr:hypothetical protein J535_0295 [Acinetobacter baumannii 1429530]EXG92888.1 hypothetical protein J624_0557 [Acinetobacter baumannii 1062314]KCY49719.1 hypothetical protein J715_1603 [Acinetobacter baumannii 1571545]
MSVELISICVVGRSATTSFNPFSFIRPFNTSKSACASLDKRSTLSTNNVSPFSDSSSSRFKMGLSSFVPDSFSIYSFTSSLIVLANFLKSSSALSAS